LRPFVARSLQLVARAVHLDKPTPTVHPSTHVDLNKEPTMTTSLTTRFASFAIAAVMTFAMLAGVNGLAVSDAPEALMARVTATHQA
jgi:hypothetical protein